MSDLNYTQYEMYFKYITFLLGYSTMISVSETFAFAQCCLHTNRWQHKLQHHHHTGCLRKEPVTHKQHKCIAPFKFLNSNATGKPSVGCVRS